MKISESIINLFNHRPVIKINEHTQLSPSSEFADGIYYIRKGAVKIFKTTGSEDFILWIGFEGDVIGLDQVFNEDKCDKTYLALKDSELIFVPIKDVRTEIEHNKVLLSDILHYISDFSNQLEERILNLNQRSVISNFAALLLNLSKLKVADIVPSIITTNDIANLIGTTTNYVYKTIQKLENKSIISFKERKLRIINKELLRKLATEGAHDLQS